MSDKPAQIRQLPLMTPSQQQQIGFDLAEDQCRTLLSVDDGVRVVIDALSETGRLGNTLIVFMSDHGLLLGEHRVQASKNLPYEEAIKIPMVIRFDPLTAGGPRSEARLVANVDIAPTIADLLDLETAPGVPLEPGCPTPPYGPCSGDFDGESLIPLLDGSATVWRDELLIETRPICAVRTSRYMFAHYSTAEEELYDLAADPYEETNLLSGVPTAETRAIRDGLHARMRQLCSPSPPDISWTPTITKLNPTSGAAGDAVTIAGRNLSGATTVKFNGTLATFSVIDDASITATVPSGATTGPIAVATPSGLATSASDFTLSTVAAPTISNFSPASGPVGSSVTITGSNLGGASSVRFGSAAASHSVDSPSQITATVPTGATSGRISITTPSGTAVSASNFTVSGAPSKTVVVVDYLFKPKTVMVGQGSTVRWDFQGPNTHTATDSLLLGASNTPLFDSGPRDVGGTYSFTFLAAGNYAYRSTEPRTMTGTVSVALQLLPASGTGDTPFTVTWSSAPIPGYVFEVQYRYRSTPSTTWSSWSRFGSLQTEASGTFLPDRGPGSYQFRSRLQNGSTGKSSKFSPTRTISVS